MAVFVSRQGRTSGRGYGGYIADNFLAVQKALGLGIKDIAGLAKNSFEASFIGEDQKKARWAEIDALAAR